jgi:Fe-S oxidoreductase
LTHCPHCFNTIKNEYKEMGGEFEVVHHTQFLSELIEKRKISLQGFERRVTFHDPCYLGRYNEIYDLPRKVLQAIPHLRLVEVSPQRQEAMCCGGGGGHMWMESGSGQRINYLRFSQVEATRPEILVTACPFCKIMLDDACNYRGLTGSIKIQDLAELVQLSIAKE